MPIKEKDARNTYQREYMKRKRVSPDVNVSPKAVSPSQNVSPDVSPDTRIAFIQSKLNDRNLIDDIERAARLFDDRPLRYKRAYRHYLWRHGQYGAEQYRQALLELTPIMSALNKKTSGLAGEAVSLLSQVSIGGLPLDQLQ